MAFHIEGLMLTCFVVVQVVASSKLITENELGSLVFVNVLFRHGDRTPVRPYPNDPYGNVSLWPVGFGQLTNTGKKQEYELGQWLRNRYASFLPEKYSKDVIYVRSTDVDRTLMSAETNLAGMFPPKDSQVWDENISWQPIPVHTIPKNMDNVLAAEKPCPAYEEEFNRVLKSEEIQKLNNSFSDVYKVLNQKTGEQVSSIEQIDWVYSTLFIETLYNFTLPNWTHSVFPSPMNEASKYSFALPTWTKKLARLKYGPLLNEMIHNMKAKEKTKPKTALKMNVYSAHDTTISGLLNSMGVYNMVNPPYTACFMMELRANSDGDHVVTMFYRNSSSETHQLTLPGCEAACPLDKFVSLLKPVTIDNWDSECNASYFSLYSVTTIIEPALLKQYKHLISYIQHLRLPVLIALGVLIALVIILLVSGTIFWMRRKRATYWNSSGPSKGRSWL